MFVSATVVSKSRVSSLPGIPAASAVASQASAAGSVTVSATMGSRYRVLVNEAFRFVVDGREEITPATITVEW